MVIYFFRAKFVFYVILVTENTDFRTKITPAVRLFTSAQVRLIRTTIIARYTGKHGLLLDSQSEHCMLYALTD